MALMTKRRNKKLPDYLPRDEWEARHFEQEQRLLKERDGAYGVITANCYDEVAFWDETPFNGELGWTIGWVVNGRYNSIVVTRPSPIIRMYDVT